jgi:hypothetical protein
LMMLGRGLGVLIAGAFVVSGPTGRVGTRIEPAVIDGGLTGDVRWHGVIAFHPEPACTGVMIGSRVVLSSRHCWEHVRPIAGRYEIFGVGGGNIYDYHRRILHGDVIDVALLPPDSTQAATWTHDLALLRLSRSSAAPHYALLDEGDRLAPSTPLTLVGYGASGPNGHDFGMKREGTVTVARQPGIAESGQLVVYYDKAPASACLGDSGGPLFVQRGSDWLVAGIHAAGYCGTTDGSMLATAVQPRLSWIAELYEEWEGSPLPLQGAAPWQSGMVMRYLPQIAELEHGLWVP